MGTSGRDYLDCVNGAGNAHLECGRHHLISPELKAKESDLYWFGFLESTPWLWQGGDQLPLAPVAVTPRHDGWDLRARISPLFPKPFAELFCHRKGNLSQDPDQDHGPGTQKGRAQTRLPRSPGSFLAPPSTHTHLQRLPDSQTNWHEAGLEDRCVDRRSWLVAEYAEGPPCSGCYR